MNFDCPTCGEMVFGSHHCCQPVWMVEYEGNIDFDGFPTEEQMWDGKRVYAHDMDEAACKFAERYQARNAWYPHEMTVFVMNERNRTINKIVVVQDPVPSYYVQSEHIQKSYGDEP